MLSKAPEPPTEELESMEELVNGAPDPPTEETQPMNELVNGVRKTSKHVPGRAKRIKEALANLF